MNNEPEENAIITIRIVCEPRYVANFIGEWEYLEEQLNENAGVDSCIIELPGGANIIELT